MTGTGISNSRVRADESVADIHAARDRLVNAGLVLFACGVPPVFFFSVFRSIEHGWNPVYILHFTVGVFLIFLAFRRQTLSYKTRAAGLLAALFVIGIGGVFSWGLLGAGTIVLMTFCTSAAVLFGIRAGLVAIGVSILAIAVTAVTVFSGWNTFPFDIAQYATSFTAWALILCGFLLFAVISVVGVGRTHAYLQRSLDAGAARNASLECANEQLRVEIDQRVKAEEEQEKLREQLFHAQKMESIGELAGGIAHDFNNVLVAISGYAKLAMENETASARLKSYISEIQMGARRAENLTRQLLAFGRRQVLETALLDPNVLLRGLDSMLARLIPESIEIVFALDKDLLSVRGDAGQIEQVVVNLSVNARDAMPDGGTLTIATENIHIDADHALAHSWAEPGEYVLISVSDTGTGIAPEVRACLFEPFFTTKPEGEGTGLGLAVAFGIVQQHNGYIDVLTEIGRGTEFRIYLPAVAEKLVQAKPEREPRPAAVAKGGTATVLLVEDDELVRRVSRRILKGAGYTVYEASEGQQALDVFDERGDEIDLVILDMVMPKMNGKEVYSSLRHCKPDLPVIFTSGYSADGIHENFVLDSGIEYLAKPYSMDVFLQRVHEVLAGHEARAQSPEAD